MFIIAFETKIKRHRYKRYHVAFLFKNELYYYFDNVNINRKAKAFSCSKFSNKNLLTFLIKVLVILNLFIIIEILIVIKASNEKY